MDSLFDKVNKYNTEIILKNRDIVYKDISFVSDFSKYTGDLCTMICSYSIKSLSFITYNSIRIDNQEEIANELKLKFFDYAHLDSIDLQVYGVISFSGLSVINYIITGIVADDDYYSSQIKNVKSNYANKLKNRESEFNFNLDKLKDEYKVEIEGYQSKIMDLNNTINVLNNEYRTKLAEVTNYYTSKEEKLKGDFNKAMSMYDYIRKAYNILISNIGSIYSKKVVIFCNIKYIISCLACVLFFITLIPSSSRESLNVVILIAGFTLYEGLSALFLKYLIILFRRFNTFLSSNNIDDSIIK